MYIQFDIMETVQHYLTPKTMPTNKTKSGLTKPELVLISLGWLVIMAIAITGLVKPTPTLDTDYDNCVSVVLEYLEAEAPETLSEPIESQFVNLDYYDVALNQFENYGNWATPSPNYLCSTDDFCVFEDGSYMHADDCKDYYQ